MAELLANLVGIALFAIPGVALTGLFPGLRATPPLGRLGYGYLLGIATLAGSLYALSALLQVSLRRPAIFGTAAVLTAAGLAAWLRARLHEQRRRPRGLRAGVRRGRLVLALAGVGVSAGLLADAVAYPLRDWDGRIQWAAQARYIRHEGSVLPLAVVGSQWFINHPRYPVLMPVAQAVVLEATGGAEDDMFFRGLYAAFFPALLLIVYDCARRWAGWFPAGLSAAAAAGIPFLTFFQDGGAAGAYSDLPLACFFGAGLTLLLRGRTFPSDGIPAGLLLGAAVLTKNEGTLLALVALFAAALVPALCAWRARRAGSPTRAARRRSRKWSRLCLATALVVAALALLVTWRLHIPNRQDESYGDLLSAQVLFPGLVTRVPEYASQVLRQTFLTWRNWMGFWWVALLVVLAGRGVLRGWRAALSWPLVLGFLAPLAVAWGAYTVSSWQPAVLARVTWERFLVQGSLPLFVLLALSLRECLSKSPLGRRLARWGGGSIWSSRAPLPPHGDPNARAADSLAQAAELG
jgi:hypothetical protein